MKKRDKDAARSGELKRLKMVVDKYYNKADTGLTPLQQACVRRNDEVVEYLISLPSCTRAAKIEALELLGALYVSEKSDDQSAFKYWLRSLVERRRAKPGDNIPPKRSEPHPVFGDDREFQTNKELNRLSFHYDDMEMQSLLIRDRILGPQHKDIYPIAGLATAAAEFGKIDRSISLVTYVLDLEQKSGVQRLLKSMGALCSVIQMFSCRVLAGKPVRYKDAMHVFTKIVDILEHNMKLDLNQNKMCDCRDFYIIVNSIGMLDQLRPSNSEDDRLQLRKLIYRFVHLNLRDLDGLTALHSAVGRQYDYQTVIHRWQQSPLEVAQLLLEVGADPRAVSLRGDTPLHCAATNKHPDQQHVIRLLLSSGAHYDACNADGKCFTELLASDTEFIVENPMQYISLQCLSAKAVTKYGLPFQSKVPSVVSEFIRFH